MRVIDFVDELEGYAEIGDELVLRRSTSYVLRFYSS